MAKQRNKPTNYDKDLHIRIHSDYLELLKQEAIKRNMTNTLMARTIIEEYFKKLENNVAITWYNGT